MPDEINQLNHNKCQKEKEREREGEKKKKTSLKTPQDKKLHMVKKSPSIQLPHIRKTRDILRFFF